MSIGFCGLYVFGCSISSYSGYLCIYLKEIKDIKNCNDSKRMEVEAGDTKFESKLDEAARKKVKEELNELNDKDRAIAVQTLRKWVKEQDWLRSPTDFAFLLRFLRVKKFSQLEARKCIENYWTSKTNIPLWFKDVDPADEKIQEILRTGFYISPKKYDKQGRRVVYLRMGQLDLDTIKQRWGLDNVSKAVLMFYDWLILDENVQVYGICLVIDYTDVTLQFMMATSTPDNVKKFLNFFQNSLSARLKAMHLYNEPAFFDGIYQMMAGFMRQKMKDRMFLHGKSLVKIFDDVGMSAMLNEYLPDEYTGPSAGSAGDIAEDMIADMMEPEFREYIRTLSSGKYGVDVAKRKADDAPVESFRKLNVD